MRVDVPAHDPHTHIESQPDLVETTTLDSPEALIEEAATISDPRLRSRETRVPGAKGCGKLTTLICIHHDRAQGTKRRSTSLAQTLLLPPRAKASRNPLGFVCSDLEPRRTRSITTMNRHQVTTSNIAALTHQ